MESKGLLYNMYNTTKRFYNYVDRDPEEKEKER